MPTWYILEDGTPGDPAKIGPDESGTLRHQDGRAVAMGPHGPRSRGMSDADIAALEQPRKYKTREAKAS